jgi:hypothetical protein
MHIIAGAAAQAANFLIKSKNSETEKRLRCFLYPGTLFN